ncbi:MAG: Cna B-type domain-containing protein [Ileibacterium sp.]|nr:Cna B-type domain-containing protein [Ileibacterium sp.]
MKTITTVFKSILLLLLTGLFLIPVQAKEQQTTGTITIVPADLKDGHIIPDTTFRLYKAEDLKNQEGIPDSEFIRQLNALTAADLQSDQSNHLADLKEYLMTHSLPGRTASAQKDGNVVFDNVEPGVYLILLQESIPGYSDPELIVTRLPSNDPGDLIGNYDVKVYPKLNPVQTMNLKVEKVWNIGKEKSVLPESITVHLLLEGNEVDQIVLSENNSWKHTFENLPESDAYTVKEDKVKGFTDTYSKRDNTWTITNTGELADTGENQYILPAMAICGGTLFAAGLILRAIRRKSL